MHYFYNYLKYSYSNFFCIPINSYKNTVKNPLAALWQPIRKRVGCHRFQ